MQAHSPRARLPLRTGSMPAQSGKLVPGLTAVFRNKQRRILYSRVYRVGIGERRLEVPHALELPRMLGAVIKLVAGERRAAVCRRVVDKLVALSFRSSCR